MKRSWEFCALLFAPGGDGPTPRTSNFLDGVLYGHLAKSPTATEKATELTVQ